MERAGYNKQIICRICMQDEMICDWHEELFKSSGVSFKDCYYRYTQLEEIDPDPFPQKLCEACSTDLKSFHLFITRAIDTQNLLEKQLTESVGISENVADDHEGIECVFLKEKNGNATEEDISKPNVSDELVKAEFVEAEAKKYRRGVRSRAKVDLNKCCEDDNKIKGSRKSICTKKEKVKHHNASGRDEDKEIKGNTKAKTPVMCSYCSKIIHNAYYLKKHEQTHKEDREREVTCSKCGLKSYTKTALYIHMKIHDKNREKKFKCEFCEKAFFHRGACNVHRRIHLGQMVKCPLCTKEFYRQIDLDKHMPSHSHAPLHAAKPTKFKYVVHCKECNKEISSANFNAHRAAHMNEPLMRCTLCEKDFFSRVSCTRHMNRVHKRTWDSYDDITVYYEKYRPRLSHVLMEQQEDVEAKKG